MTFLLLFTFWTRAHMTVARVVCTRPRDLLNLSAFVPVKICLFELGNESESVLATPKNKFMFLSFILLIKRTLTLRIHWSTSWLSLENPPGEEAHVRKGKEPKLAIPICTNLRTEGEWRVVWKYLFIPHIIPLNKQRTTWVPRAVPFVWPMLVSAKVKTEVDTIIQIHVYEIQMYLFNHG